MQTHPPCDFQERPGRSARGRFFALGADVSGGGWLRALTLGAAAAGAAAPAAAETVLERVLSQIAVSGLFVNAAQNGFGPAPMRIDASVTSLFEGGLVPGAAIAGASSSSALALALGQVEALALGATNAGDLILSVSVAQVQPGSLSPAEDDGSGVSPAITLFMGENSSLAAQTDMVRVDALVAMSQEIAMQSWQIGTVPETTVAALNLASNGSDVTARILTHVDGAVLSARDMTATAIGAVNVGLARVIGGAQR
jgi:hypothetical protein